MFFASSIRFLKRRLTPNRHHHRRPVLCGQYTTPIWVYTRPDLFPPHEQFEEMDTRSTLDILAFAANDDGKDINAVAKVDRQLSFNIISTAQAYASGLQWSVSPRPRRARDSDGNYYESSSFLTLRWCERNGMQTWDADFYIVDTTPYDIILTGDSVPLRRVDSDCYPVFNPLPTKGKGGC